MPPESSELVNRRAFLQVAASAVTGAAVAGESSEIASARQVRSSPNTNMRNGHHRDGQLYMQTNEIKNTIIHYRYDAHGALIELERIPTGGAGSGTFKPISGQEKAPNAFEGAGSVILTPDRQFLFTTNGGNNSVSSFRVGEGGRLTLLDVKPTGNTVEGRSGTAKSLAYAPSSGTLFVLHSFGPDHLRLMSIDNKGRLMGRPERYTINRPTKPNRVATMVVISPNEKFVFVGSTFDQPPVLVGTYPDGSPILWVRQPDGSFKVIASNAPDPDGLAVFPMQEGGSLGAVSFHDAKGASPFAIAFLHTRPDTLIIGYAVANGCAMATVDENGKIDVGPLVKIDTSAGLPSELCWLTISPDDQTVYATPFGYSYVSSYHLINRGDMELTIARDPACPKVSGDGTFRAIDGTVSSGPSDSWITPDGAYFYQIYANASKLIGYATQPDGSLHEISSVKIPYDSPQGLAGF